MSSGAERGRIRQQSRLLDRLGPFLLAGAALAAAYYHQTATVALASTLLLALLITRYWGRHSLDAVRYQRQMSDDRAFPDDELLLTLRLSNDKLLPLPWLEVEDRLPNSLELVPEEGCPPQEGEDGLLRLAGSATWKERISWRHRLLCRRRGIYALGPAVVTSGDPFGFFPRSASMGGTTRLVVYPRLLDIDSLDLPSGFPLGERKAARWIFEDPSRTVGVRDYRRGDSFRRIHWKATARRQELQVKLHEPTTTLETALFLALDTFERGAGTGGQGDRETGGRGDPATRGHGDAAKDDGLPLPLGEGRGEGALPPLDAPQGEGDVGDRGPGRPHGAAPTGTDEGGVGATGRSPLPEASPYPTEGGHPGPPLQDPAPSTQPSSLITHHPSLHFEHAVSIVASLAHDLVGQRHPVGLYVNGGEKESRLPLELPPGSSEDQLIKILEFLAGVEPSSCLPAESFLAQVSPRLPWGSTLILVAAELSEPMLAALQTLARSGRKPGVLLVGKGSGEGVMGGVPVHAVTPGTQPPPSPGASPADG